MGVRFIGWIDGNTTKLVVMGPNMMTGITLVDLATGEISLSPSGPNPVLIVSWSLDTSG